jgi:hypothetical protein
MLEYVKRGGGPDSKLSPSQTSCYFALYFLDSIIKAGSRRFLVCIATMELTASGTNFLRPMLCHPRCVDTPGPTAAPSPSGENTTEFATQWSSTICNSLPVVGSQSLTESS